VDIDDLKNPEYRKGRYRPAPAPKVERHNRPPPNEQARRAKFATQTARSEFGRFYWNDELGRRMERELQKARRQQREAAERARERRKRNGTRDGA
jgi:hypothetical protein